MTTIKELRRAKGWSQIKLAIEAGVSPTTISKLERGSECNLTTKRAIADALGVSPNDVDIPVKNWVELRRA